MLATVTEPHAQLSTGSAAPSSEPDAGQPGGGEPGGGNPHGHGSAGDLVRSLGVILALVLVVVALAPRPEGETSRVVDYAGALATAAAAASYDVLAPESLPAGWVVVSAGSERLTGGDQGGLVWRLDMRTSDQRFVSLEQSDAGHGPLVRRETQQAAPAGIVRLASGDRELEWTRYVRQEQRSLVHQTTQSWTVVTGDASWPELEGFVATLRPASPAPSPAPATD